MIKKSKIFSFMGMIAALFVCGSMLTGCGESGKSEESSDAKYLLYKKEGNAKDGYYIHVFGLNVECDEGGNLKVNLDELVTKKQGKLVIPAQIDGLPVKKVSLNKGYLGTNLGGTVTKTGTTPIRAVTDSELKFYLAQPDTYYTYINDVVVPEGVEKLDLRYIDLNNLNVPASVKECYANVKNKLVIPLQAFVKSSMDISASELEVVANDSIPVTEKVYIRAEKSAILPANIKKIDVSFLFYHAASGWDKAFKIREECKGFKLTCAPDATIVGDDDYGTKEIRSKLFYGDVYVNGENLEKFLK